MKRGPKPSGKPPRKIPGRRRGPSKHPFLRTKANAERICRMTAEGLTLREISAELGVTAAAIVLWVQYDERTKRGMIAAQYAEAKEAQLTAMADELMQLADDRSFMKHPRLANSLVAQQRLAVDTRKWLLTKMLPKRFGDHLEVSGNPDAPVVTRIELVAVHPAPREIAPPTIDNELISRDTPA